MARMEEQGIAGIRGDFAGKTKHTSEHLAHYHRIDIALDTFPYNGTTTTCDALWMGVPVVAIAGDRHVARVGVSLLTNVGLPEMIGSSIDAYISIAAALAKDVERLRTIRQTLREQMRKSPLIDAPSFVRDLEEAYRRMWRAWAR